MVQGPSGRGQLGFWSGVRFTPSPGLCDLQGTASLRTLMGKGSPQPGLAQTLTLTPRGIWPRLPTPSWEVIALQGSICLPTSQHLVRINTSSVASAAQQTPFYRTIGSSRQRLHFHGRAAILFAFWHVTSMAVHVPHPCCLPALFYFARAPSD